MNYKCLIKQYLENEIAILQQLDIDAIDDALNILNNARIQGRNIYVFGNGGSGATASHMQNDFNRGISQFIEQKFNFCSLNDNMPTIMAIANDIGFEGVFRLQLMNRLNPEDVVMAISGSGNSPNVINAVEYAKERGCKIIGLTGYSGGKLKKLSDISLHVPVNSMQITEDIHMIYDHLMMSVFYKTLCEKEHLQETWTVIHHKNA